MSMKITRRSFCTNVSLVGTSLALTPGWLSADEKKSLPTRRIPGSDARLPIIGLGNSNAFRAGDTAASSDLLGLLDQFGGQYVDCSGASRMTVARAAREAGIAQNLFLGTYFTEEDDARNRAEAELLKAITGKDQLDLMQSYPEFAIPNWKMFEAWKAEGLTRFIGMARHRSEFYAPMMEVMDTGTVDFIQVNYSPLETEADQEILPMALDKGVAVTINRPFINGEYFSLVAGHEVPEWASEFDCDNWAAFSIKFILSHPAVTCVLTETANPKHATQNLSAGFGRLPDEATRKRMVAYLQNL